jgi:hypothetical protein
LSQEEAVGKILFGELWTRLLQKLCEKDGGRRQKSMPFLQKPRSHTYCRAKHWPYAEHLDRLLKESCVFGQAAINPYTI